MQLRWKYSIIGVIVGVIFVLLERHLLGLAPLLSWLSMSIIYSSNFDNPWTNIILIMVLNGILYGFIGFLIGLYKESKYGNKVKFKKSHLIILIISLIVISTIYSTITYLELGLGFHYMIGRYLTILALLIYGFLFSTLFTKKKEFFKFNSKKIVLLIATLFLFPMPYYIPPFAFITFPSLFNLITLIAYFLSIFFMEGGSIFIFWLIPALLIFILTLLVSYIIVCLVYKGFSLISKKNKKILWFLIGLFILLLIIISLFLPVYCVGGPGGGGCIKLLDYLIKLLDYLISFYQNFSA